MLLLTPTFFLPSLCREAGFVAADASMRPRGSLHPSTVRMRPLACAGDSPASFSGTLPHQEPFSAVARPFIPSRSSKASPPAFRHVHLHMSERPQQQYVPVLSTALAASIPLIVATRVALNSLPPLFRLHVLCMLPLFPLGTAGVEAVRRRLAKPDAEASPTERKKRSVRWVKTHFAMLVPAMYSMAAGLVSIWRHKQAIGRAHLTSAHSRFGVAALCIWMAAYVAAQPKVWRSSFKGGRFRYRPRWLWASDAHRRLGTTAYLLSACATASGLNSAWSRRALGGALATASAAGVGLVAAVTLTPAANAFYASLSKK
mmetsp:Transcript_59753/g.129498  ORF Transcript_59753/g.129498 Transcript_59753/m.129498 type:complete len:316 (-) Transcript_59753:514-1461(-)